MIMIRFSNVRLVLLISFLLVKDSFIVSAQSASKYLYVWVGSGVKGADYLATVDFVKGSATYGKVVSKALLTTTSTRSAKGNEPHHIRIIKTVKGKNLIVGSGLLSFLQGKDDVFVWNLDTPKQPKLVASYNLPGGCADEINQLRVGKLDGVLVTMMCNDKAVAPGHWGFLDPVTGSHFDWVNASSYVNFNPHGFAVHSNGKYLFATDFTVPGALVTGPPIFRNTLRRFDLNRANPVLDHTYSAGNATEGFPDFQFIPGTTKGYVFGAISNLVYFVDVSKTTNPVQVFDLAKAVSGGKRALSVSQIQILKSGKYLITSFARRYLVGLDITNRLSPKVFFKYDFCKKPVTGNQYFNCTAGNPGAHYVHVTPNEDRVVVVNYFLQFGILKEVDASTIAVFDLAVKSSGPPQITYDPKFSSNFFPDRPHGVQTL